VAVSAVKSQFQRFAFNITLVHNENAEQKVYQKEETRILAIYTLAFPSVKRVLRYVDRFADAAFTKDTE
jgi:hypothetical protein